MRIIHLSTTDSKGGAGLAAYRLHTALLNKGVDSVMCVQRKYSKDSSVHVANKPFSNVPAYALFDRVGTMVDPQCWGEKCSTGLVGTCDVSTVVSLQPDLIHVHWINSGFLSVRQFEKLPTPIVMTLHDEWWYQSVKHYGTESRFVSCVYESLRKKKIKTIKNKKVSLVVPSQWLKNNIEKQTTALVVPHGVKDTVFCPTEKGKAKRDLGLDPNKKTLLFGAANIQERRKGVRELLESLDYVSRRENIEVAIFGSGASKMSCPLPVSVFGYVNDERKKSLLYAAADVMCVPSLHEAFGLTALEAHMSGTSVVAFADTGVSDIIAHQQTGYLARWGDTIDYAKGIDYCLDNSNRLGHASRVRAFNFFSEDQMAKKYESLYRNMID